MKNFLLILVLLLVPTSCLAQSTNDLRNKAEEWKRVHLDHLRATQEAESQTKEPDGHGGGRNRTKVEVAAAVQKRVPELDAIDTNYRKKIDPIAKNLKVTLPTNYMPEDVHKVVEGK